MKNSNLYSNLAIVCTKFYDLAVDEKKVAEFVESKIGKFEPKKILFVGGFFLVAKELLGKGYDLTVVDYTDEMVAEGKKRLPNTRIIKADVRDLPFKGEFDAVLVIGRVFTHMYSNDDANKALQSIRKSLKPNGILLFDNYEDSKITKTNYFNGKICLKEKGVEITRDSTTELISTEPFIVNWKATYTLKENGKSRRFKDGIEHRAFSRKEIKELVEHNGLKQIENGNNFDETSFYSIARKAPQSD